MWYCNYMAASSHRGKAGTKETARLIAVHLPTVRRVCQAHLSRPADVDDAVQETFVAFLRADRKRIKNVEAWLVRVAVRSCNHIHRWHYGHPEAELIDGFGAQVSDAVLDDVLDLAFFHKLTSHLPRLDRQVLSLLFLHDMPRDLVAEHLGITSDHLRVVVFRARKRTQQILAAYNDGFGI